MQSFGRFTVCSFNSSRSLVGHVSDKFVGKEKPLPKPQRRGAIIILGMLALAKRSVLTDKVAVMLRVGLGPLGKVRIMSFKKISFNDTTGGSHVGAVYLRGLTTAER